MGDPTMKHLAPVALLLALALAAPACASDEEEAEYGCTCDGGTCTGVETCKLIIAAEECRWHVCDYGDPCTPPDPAELPHGESPLDQYCPTWVSGNGCDTQMCLDPDPILQCQQAIAEAPCEQDDLLWEWPPECVSLFDAWGCTEVE